MLLPSGTNTALTTKSVWPFTVASGLQSRSHSCAVFTEAVRTRPPSGRERRGDRIVVALRRAPFAPGVIFWQPPFRLAAQICKVLRRPPRRLPFQRATDEICTPRLAGALPRADQGIERYCTHD